MRQRSSNLWLAALQALTMVAAALVAGTRFGSWPSFAAPLLLVVGLLGTDLVVERRAGRRWPSAGALVLAATIAVTSAMLLAGGGDRLVALVPALGCAAAAPTLWRGERPDCMPRAR